MSALCDLPEVESLTWASTEQDRLAAIDASLYKKVLSKSSVLNGSVLNCSVNDSMIVGSMSDDRVAVSDVAASLRACGLLNFDGAAVGDMERVVTEAAVAGRLGFLGEAELEWTQWYYKLKMGFCEALDEHRAILEGVVRRGDVTDDEDEV
jgi:hypothetical protein